MREDACSLVVQLASPIDEKSLRALETSSAGACKRRCEGAPPTFQQFPGHYETVTSGDRDPPSSEHIAAQSHGVISSVDVRCTVVSRAKAHGCTLEDAVTRRPEDRDEKKSVTCVSVLQRAVSTWL